LHYFMLSRVSGCVLLVCPKHVELILEINKTVIVASSWSSIFTLPILIVFSDITTIFH
jgi:hypothetical protein